MSVLVTVYYLTILGIFCYLLVLLSLPSLFSRRHTYNSSLSQIQLVANGPVQLPNELTFPLLPLAISDSTNRQWSLFSQLFECSLQTWIGLYQAMYCTQISLILPSTTAGFLLGLPFDPEDGDNLFL